MFGPEARQLPFVLGGDMNIPTLPANQALGALYGAPAGTGDFAEIDSERDCAVTVFCDVQLGICGADRHLCSDHWLLMGQLLLPAG